MELKADDGCRGIRRHLQAVGPDRKHREQITVRMVAGGRTRTAIARRAEVSPGLQRSPWQLRGLRIASISRKLGYVRRDIHHQPVPEPAARGASGSKQVMAKLFVPAGAPDHARCGDWLLPAQPKPKSADRIWALAR